MSPKSDPGTPAPSETAATPGSRPASSASTASTGSQGSSASSAGAASTTSTSSTPSAASGASTGSAGTSGSSGKDSTAKDSTASAPATTSKAGQRDIRQRKGQFLIAPRRHPGLQMMGIAPLSLSVVEQALRDAPDIEIIDRIGPRQTVGALASGLQEGGVLVAMMNDDKAQALSLQGQGQLIVERDQPLQLLDTAYPEPSMVTCSLPQAGAAFSAEFLVLGDDKPVIGAEVYLFGSLLPANGVTDASGRVRLTLFGESAASVRRLYVKPRADYWSYSQEQPDITDQEINVIGLRALSDWPSLKNFPKQQQLTWGQKAMRLDQVPATLRGHGIKIAIVDSGAANGHQDLTNITRGVDIVNKARDRNTWNVDTIAHGSHCAGVISGVDSATGIRGFAPDAEVHACKLFPGGQISQLIEALEYCIEQQIDVVNLSLGGAQPSEALEQQLLRARQAGVACIVAAGNSGGPVQYPGSSPQVLAVSAIGRVNEFPADSYHAHTVTGQVDPNGFYAARFSCYGPEISVCAPGVAITSSVPDNNFAAWDGTSMAAPHVTGLAALILAHHPEFQTAIRVRNAERVDRLFQIIRQSCTPLMLGDPRRTGFGLPDAPRALGLVQAQAQAQAGAGLLGSMLGASAMQSVAQAYRDMNAALPQNVGLGMATLSPYAVPALMAQAMRMPTGYGYGYW